MKRFCFISLLSLMNTVALAQHVAWINGKAVTNKEFMWVYKKNHGGVSGSNYQDLRNYLELYINFKLKVLDARAMGLDSDADYKAEISGYENALKSRKKSAKNMEYAFIMNEYREGVLMFNVSEKKIWSKTADNESGLYDFYLSNRNRYEGKSFENVRGQVIVDFQQSLENDWLKTLRTKYTVKVNEEELKKLAKP